MFYSFIKTIFIKRHAPNKQQIIVYFNASKLVMFYRNVLRKCSSLYKTMLIIMQKISKLKLNLASNFQRIKHFVLSYTHNFHVMANETPNIISIECIILNEPIQYLHKFYTNIDPSPAIDSFCYFIYST